MSKEQTQAESDTNSGEQLVETNTEDDLAAFEQDFFQLEPTEVDTKQEDVSEVTENSEEDLETQDEEPSEDEDLETVETEEEADADEADEEPEEETVEEESVKQKPKPKKKNRFQERIDNLVAEREEEKRQRIELETRLKALENKGPNADDNTTEKPKTAPVKAGGPQSSDKNEDGTEKYPLGEYDPNYIRDLAIHSVDERERQLEEARKEREQEQEAEQQRTALESNWQEKLTPAKAQYEDFDEKSQRLVPLLTNVDPAYGEYLSGVLMGMDHGPDVMYYLADNLDEASTILSKGPAGAAVALGRIESRFAEAKEAKKQARPKTSKAPAPPVHRTRGSSQSMPVVPDDTDDLDAFERKLFQRK